MRCWPHPERCTSCFTDALLLIPALAPHKQARRRGVVRNESANASRSSQLRTEARQSGRMRSTSSRRHQGLLGARSDVFLFFFPFLSCQTRRHFRDSSMLTANPFLKSSYAFFKKMVSVRYGWPESLNFPFDNKESDNDGHVQSTHGLHAGAQDAQSVSFFSSVLFSSRFLLPSSSISSLLIASPGRPRSR